MFKYFLEEAEKFNPKKGINFKGFKGFGFIDSAGALSSKSDIEELDTNTLRSGILVGFILLAAFFLVFVSRALVVQIIGRDRYLSLAKDNRMREVLIQPERGVVFDRKGIVLARNKPAFYIQLNTQICSPDLIDISDCQSNVQKVKELTGAKIDEERVTNELNERRPIVLIASGLEKSQILSLEANLRELPGLLISVQPVREYVYPQETAHVIGYVGLDEKDKRPVFVGKTGMEESYNQFLAGIPGNQIVQIDSTGKDFQVVAQKDSLPGRNVTLYLDSKLQNKAFELLKKKIEDSKPDPKTGFRAEAGVVIAQDPRTGGILTMVSYPSFDSNKMTGGISLDEYNKVSSQNFPFFNRAVAASYPPGSTFKMVVASAALMEDVVTEKTIVFDPGYIQVGSFIFRNWNLGGHGDVNLLRALQVSNDTYFYTLGGGHGSVKGLGIEKLSEWARKFGFGSKTGVDITGEVPGYFPDGIDREWYLGDTYITSIGQGDVLVTPLQLNNMVTYFANGGYLIVPRVVKSVDGSGEEETIVIAQNIVDKKYYDLVRQGMHLSVKPGGTGYPVYDFPIRHKGIELAGKTGTAEYKDRNGKDRTHAWFSVFGPYNEEPGKEEIALTVFLEGGGGGADEAAPIAKELLDTWFEGR